MAFRLTNTDKYGNPWFRRLKPQHKAIWQFLKDDCDHAGIWTIDYDSIEFHVGLSCAQADLEEWFSAKLIWLAEDKVFIPEFLDEQYGRGQMATLDPANRFHRSVIAILNANGINPNDYRNTPQGPSKGLTRPMEGAKSITVTKEVTSSFDTTEKKESKGMAGDLFGDDTPPPQAKSKKRRSPKEGISFELIPEFSALGDFFQGQIATLVQQAWLKSYGRDYVDREIRKAHAWNARKNFLRKDLNRFYGGWLARGYENTPTHGGTPQSDDLSPMARELRRMEAEKNGHGKS